MSNRDFFREKVFNNGTELNTDEVLLHGVQPVKTGSKIEGQFFPLIYIPKPKT